MIFKTTCDHLKCLFYEWLIKCYLLRIIIFRLHGFFTALQNRWKTPAPTRCFDVLACTPELKKVISFEIIREAVSVQNQEKEFVGVFLPALIYPPLFRFSAKGWRVIANGVVISDSNAIVANVSPDFIMGYCNHRLCEAWRIPSPIPLDEDLIVLSSLGYGGNYYHWVFDCFSRLMLVSKEVQRTGKYLVEHSLPYQKAYLRLFGIELERCIEPSLHLHLLPQTLHVPSLPGDPGIVPPETVAFLRQLRDRATAPISSPYRRVFLIRTGHIRTIANNDEVINLLEQHEFQCIDPSELSVEQQMRLLVEAKIVVSVHGAALTNIVYCTPETTVLELMPEAYTNNCYRHLAHVCQLRYDRFVCKSVHPQAGVSSKSTSSLYIPVISFKEKLLSVLAPKVMGA